MKKYILLGLFLFLLTGCISSNDFTLYGKTNYYLMQGSYFKDPLNNKQVKAKETLNTNKTGIQTLTYNYQGKTLKRYIHIIKGKALTLSLLGDSNQIVYLNQTYIENGANAYSQVDGYLNGKIKINGHVNSKKKGIYKVYYSIEDSKGYTYTKVRNVHVIDKDKVNTLGIPVYMYHWVYTKNDVPKHLNNNYILDTKLEKQLQYYKKNQYYFPSFKELKAYVENKIDLPVNSAILTFDDGQKGFLKYGLPLLEKYQIPATSFLIGSKNASTVIKKYASNIINYQSHSYNMHHGGGGNIGHGGIIYAMNTKQVLDDLVKMKNLLQNNDAFAYPYGDTTNEAVKAVKESKVLCAFTTKNGRVTRHMDLALLPRVRVSGDN